MAQECTGAGHVQHRVRMRGQSITHVLRFLEENKQEHLTFLKKEKRHSHNKNISESDCLLEKADQCV